MGERRDNIMVGDSNCTFLQLDAVMMEAISRGVILSGNRTEVPKFIAFNCIHVGGAVLQCNPFFSAFLQNSGTFP